MAPSMSQVPLVSSADADLAYDAAQRVVETHRRLVGFLKPGLTLGEIDRFVAVTLGDLKCRSCFLGYRVRGLPAFPSHACLSVNECVVHGTASYLDRPIAVGDLLKVDIGVTYRNWIGDAAWTYSIGEPSPANRKLMDASKESLRLGIAALQPGETYRAWAQAVQGHVEGKCGLHLVQGLGGHGYGKRLHTPPFVSNSDVGAYSWPDGSKRIEAGTLIALEPMVAIGTGQTRQGRGEWPIYSADGSMTAHHEHDVYITPKGPRVLTEGLDELPDVIQ